MLAQAEYTTYTDPITGYSLVSDSQAYADASVALVKANAHLADLTNLIALQDRLIQDAGAAGYPLPQGLINLHADALTEHDIATNHRGTLQAYVDRYRYMVFGSGVAGLGLLPVLAVAAYIGIAAVAAALGYFLVRSYDLAAARVALQQYIAEYQRWLGEQAVAGTIDAPTLETLTGAANQLSADVAASGGGFLDFLKGPLGLVVVAAVAFMAFQSTRR
jgi:hypothetical protein